MTRSSNSKSRDTTLTHLRLWYALYGVRLEESLYPEGPVDGCLSGGYTPGVLEAPGGGPYPRVPWGPCADPLSGAHFGASRDPRFRGPGGAPGPPRKKCTFRRVFNNSPIRDRMGQNGKTGFFHFWPQFWPLGPNWAGMGFTPISMHKLTIKKAKSGPAVRPATVLGVSLGGPAGARPGPGPLSRARARGRARGAPGRPRGHR